MPAKSSHHALGGTCVLHFDHCALAWQIHTGLRLRNHTVQASALETREPIECDGPVACHWREINRWRNALEQLFKCSTSRRLRHVHQIASARLEQIESDEGRRRVIRE